MSRSAGAGQTVTPDSRASWLRLAICITLSAIGGVGMWSPVVSLPAVQADFGVARAWASAPFTVTMLVFGFGGIWAGRWADRAGVARPAIFGGVLVGVGYLLSALAPNMVLFTLAQGGLVAFGASATFGPLIADISHWFVKRRGLAVGLCAAGNYVAGAVWPPIVQHFIAQDGWRAAHAGVGLFCLVAIPTLALTLRRRALPATAGAQAAPIDLDKAPIDNGLGRAKLQVLLMFAGLSCCIAMAMPQGHIVAYCGDLGYGPARGAEMLALMMGFGIFSRVGSGYVADRIGGVATLLIGSFLQGLALLLYVMFDGLAALYVVSALFGLFQGGITPSYAIIVRESFAPREAGEQVGRVFMATLVGMAVGGWASGAIFDLTGSYRMAFLHGLAWNLVNVALIGFLLSRRLRVAAMA